ncbi:hypothetical protein [Nocardia sp. NPDC052112]|uniref:hypothetical protein n=1 Tax=Nocardia sp. NPDC052112 TaxID=3155646 RepID=UPI00343DE6C2
MSNHAAPTVRRSRSTTTVEKSAYGPAAPAYLEVDEFGVWRDSGDQPCCRKTVDTAVHQAAAQRRPRGWYPGQTPRYWSSARAFSDRMCGDRVGAVGVAVGFDDVETVVFESGAR